MDLLEEEHLEGFTMRSLSLLEAKVRSRLSSPPPHTHTHRYLLTSSTLPSPPLPSPTFQSGKAHQVIQFHIHNWRPDGHCSNFRAVTDVIEEVGKVQRRTGNRPILIHCRWALCGTRLPW